MKKLINLLQSREAGTSSTTSVDYGENTRFVYFTVRYADSACSAECVILDEGEMDKVVAEWTAIRRTRAEVA